MTGRTPPVMKSNYASESPPPLLGEGWEGAFTRPTTELFRAATSNVDRDPGD